MNAGPIDTLRSLRDVGDLLGSFVVSDFGEVVLRDVPSVFDDETLDEAATRLVRLRETLDGDDDRMENALLDYGDHKLLLRAFAGAILVVLAPRSVNVPSLRMASTLVARKLERSLGAVPAAPPPAHRPAASVLPPTTPTHGVTAPRPSAPPVPAAMRTSSPPASLDLRDVVPPPPPPLASSTPPQLPKPPATPKRIFRGVPID